MRKTTVYLTDDEAEGLRRLAGEAGTSQAELIREGVRRLIGQPKQRKFRSMGLGDAPGSSPPHWDSDGLLKEAMGER